MKPILFNTQMVRAILDGKKTMTRRVIKPLPDGEVTYSSGGYGICKHYGMHIIPSPYYSGDILWVRETWQKLHDWLPSGGLSEEGRYFYYADGQPDCQMTDGDGFSLERFLWRPSIHMPREAARIFLRVTNVRAERVQDITETDALLEGCLPHKYGALGYFKPLWDDINYVRGYGWDINPWVWVISFERCEP